VAVGWYCRTADANCEVEFHEAVASSIPSLIKLLEDWDEYRRWEIIEIIENLSNHG
jgi:hypothetical protein